MDAIEQIGINDKVVLTKTVGKYPAGAKGIVVDRYNMIRPGGNHMLSLRVEMVNPSSGKALEQITVPYGHAVRL